MLEKRSTFIEYSVDTCLELQEEDRILTVVPHLHMLKTNDVYEAYSGLSDIYDEIDYDVLLEIGDFAILRVAWDEDTKRSNADCQLSVEKKRRSKSYSTPVNNAQFRKDFSMQ